MDKMTHVQKGVSLLESMIALLIFLIAAVGWISLEANLARTSGQTQVIAQAVFVGQSRIDELRSIPFEELASSTTTSYYDEGGNPVGEEAPEGLIYGIDWTVTTPTENENIRRVQVTVTWNIDNEIQDTLQLYLTRAR